MSERPPFGPDHFIFTSDHPNVDFLPSIKPAFMYLWIRIRRYLGDGKYQYFIGTEEAHARVINEQKSAVRDMIAERIRKIGA